MQIRVAVPPGRFHRDPMDADVLGLQDGGVIKILLDNERKMGDKECGEVTSADGAPIDYARYPIGSFLEIAPYHSCASTHQHGHVHVLETAASREVSEVWRICKGW